MLNDNFKDRVIEYFKKYHKQHKKVPPTRQVFKRFSKAKFYHAFPKGVAEACKLAGIPVPEAHIERTEKAVQALKKKRVVGATEEATSWEDLKQSYKREKDEGRYRKKKSEELAKQVRKLATDPNEKISGPVLGALAKVLPSILKRCYGINLSLWAMKKLDEIMHGEMSYETLTRIVEWTKLSDEKQQAILDLCKNPGGTELDVISEYAKLSDEEKEAVKIVVVYASARHMSPIEVVASLDMERRMEEDGVRAFLAEE